ncbi:MAG: hypothetical protein K9J16_17055 [Melioribacteraceae bacterium]|nr:hypothetical protein [Melioribacteraceae bacterium]MCF8353626.1 hypothetical protein [Melioribacteraceae bacterium]MCF8393396.1 hypothetical protein [Melioribacteraceae bacterium]MCF8419253.1 hypothetical protein [Melioribacteraceae bacterium]
MFENTLSSEKNLTGRLSTVNKLTALWGFSEAALGGILHALRIPFTGLFIGGSAILFIGLIAHFSDNKISILRSTSIVIIVKAVVSPHSPLAAYLSVFLQGLIGYGLFSFIKNYKISVFLLALTTLTISGMQKIIILTIVFGNTLWDSINLFSSFVLEQFLTSGETAAQFNISYWLIGLYVGIHITGGIIIGLIAMKIPKWINTKIDEVKADTVHLNERFNEFSNSIPKKRKRKHWWQKKSGWVLIIVLVGAVSVSYFYPEYSDNKISEIGIMMIRFIFIMLIWYTVVSPYLVKLFRKYVNKKKNEYAAEIDNIIVLFPKLKSLIHFTWKSTEKMKGFKKIKTFLSLSFIYLLIADFE